MEELEQVEVVEEIVYVKEKKELPKNLDMVAAIVAIIGLFFPLFTISVFGYTVASISGINLLSGSDLGSMTLFLFGLLVVGSPIIVLVTILVDAFKIFKKVFSVVFPAASLLLIVLTYGYITAEYGSYGSLTFGLGFWLYGLGSAVLIAMPFIQGEKIEVSEIQSAFKKSSSKLMDLSGELFSVDCLSCGEKNAKNKNFCTKCGKDLPKTKIACVKCKEQISASAAFCPKCGEKIAE